MSKILYFDAFNGAAGDMILGALIDLGMPLCHLKEELAKLSLEGYTLTTEKVKRQGLFGIDFRVGIQYGETSATGTPEEGFGTGDSGRRESSERKHHHHDHDHRGFAEIRQLIESSSLDDRVKETAVRIFRRLAEAEAKVHGSTVEEVHFHEVGAIDSIIDIVGACIGFRYFEIDEFYTSPLNLGGGTVTFSHGIWPVPTPATAELIAGFPSRLNEHQFEMTTPTGAAIITTLARPVMDMPTVLLERSGFGAGDNELSGIPNMLRLWLGKSGCRSYGTGPEDGGNCTEEEIILFETTVDDMDGETWGYFLENAFKEGALDVYFTPVQMKKNRPGILVSLICRPQDQDRMADFIFRETTTLGLRRMPTCRLVLEREVRTLATEFGEVRYKVGRCRGKVANVSPEFEDLRRIARESGMPLKTVKQKLMDRWEEEQL